MSPRWDSLRPPGRFSASRRPLAWALAILGPALVTLGVEVRFEPVALLPSVLFAAVVVGAALLGGLRPGVVGSILSSVGIWYAVMPPKDAFTVRSVGEGIEELVALALFVTIAIAASAFVGRLERALDQAHAARLRVAFIAEASELLASSLELDTTFRRLARLGVDALAEWGTVDLLDEETGEIRRVAVAHRDRAREHELDRLAEYRPFLTLRGDLVARVAAGEVVAGVVDDDTFVPEAARDDTGVTILRGLAPRSYLLVPLVQAGAVVGAMTFVRGSSQPPFAAGDVELARELARRAEIAVDNARLYQREHEANERLVLLGEASRVLASTLDVEQAFRRMAAVLVPAMADICYLDLLDEDRVSRYAWVLDGHPEAERLERWPPELSGANPISSVLRTGETVVIADITEDVLRRAARDPAHFELVSRMGFRTCIVVPLVTRGQVVGALSVFRTGDARAFSRADLGVVEVLARRVAMAVENGRLFVRQRELNETLQRSLLPPALPEHPGVAAAARYLPAGAAMDVGGDWYDVFAVRGGTLAVALGDVAGHGAHAASVMGQLRNALRAYLVEDGDPARALARLDALLTSLEPGEMATVSCAVLDTEHGTLDVSSAGHLPPLLVDARGGARRVDHHRGLPLGTGAAAEYRTTRFHMEPGEMLLLYTDGLVEDRRRALDVSLDHLLGIATELSTRALSPARFCDELVACLLGNESPDDDVAVLAVQLCALGRELVLRVPADPAAMAPLRRTLRRWLRSVAGVGEAEMPRIVAAAGEACANAVEHAGRVASDRFTLVARTDADRIEISVRDAGRWRPSRGTNRGHGLVLMRALADDVDVVTGSEGTEVVLRWAREPVLR